MKQEFQKIQQRLAALTPEQKALVKLRLQQKSTSQHPLPQMIRHAEHNVFPLSFAQESLWFLHQLEPDNPAYNIPLAFCLKGKIHIKLLEQAIITVARHQDMLRASFSYGETGPIQTIDVKVKLMLPVVDCQNVATPKSEEIASQLMLEGAQVPFDLSLGPVVRFLLFRLQPEYHLLFMVIHHIISDGWSIHIMLEDLMTVYGELIVGRSGVLQPLPVQYGDYALWQREYLTDSVLKQVLNYWTSQVKVNDSLLLAYDYPHVIRGPQRIGIERFFIGPKLLTALKNLRTMTDTTLFMILLAAFQLLLYRFTQQNKFVVGIAMSNRDQAETKRLVGLFVNLLVFQANFEHIETFGELLQYVRRTCIEAYSHQHLPFEKLVQALHPKRRGTSIPFIQIVLDYQKAQDELAPQTHLLVEPLQDFSSGSSRFDLTIRLSEHKEQIKGAFEYNQGRFMPETIARLVENFMILLTQLAGEPDMRIAEFCGQEEEV